MISPKAKISKNVKIASNCIIGENVKIDTGCEIGPNVVILGNTIIGKNNKIHAGAVIGNITQALTYKGEKSYLIIGNNNIIREYVTINATEGKETPTIIGNNNLFMAYSHIAHHCKIGNNIVIANSGTLGGHVIIEDNVIIGGLAAIHQFCRVGKYSIIGGLSKIVKDVIPFITCDGNPARLRGLNYIGLKRNKFSKDERNQLKKAYKILFKSRLKLENALDRLLEEFKDVPNIKYLVDFIKNSKRGIIRDK